VAAGWHEPPHREGNSGDRQFLRFLKYFLMSSRSLQISSLSTKCSYSIARGWRSIRGGSFSCRNISSASLRHNSRAKDIGSTLVFAWALRMVSKLTAPLGPLTDTIIPHH